jgi:hypothetical protein
MVKVIIKNIGKTTIKTKDRPEKTTIKTKDRPEKTTIKTKDRPEKTTIKTKDRPEKTTIKTKSRSKRTKHIYNRETASDYEEHIGGGYMSKISNVFNIFINKQNQEEAENNKKILENGIEEAFIFLEKYKNIHTLNDEEKKNVVDIVSMFKQHGIYNYNTYDNKQINIEKTENITKFSSAFITIVGIGLLGTTIIGNVTTFGSLIAITSVFTLLGLWLISKISLEKELKSSLIILIGNLLHMIENITKIREIIKKKIVKNDNERQEDYNERVDNFISDNVSSKYKVMKYQIQKILESYLDSITDKKYIIMFLITIKNANINVTMLNNDESYKKNILFDEKMFTQYIQNIENEKSSTYLKIKKKTTNSLTNIANFFTQSSRLRILNRESNITNQMFSLLMSDVLIYTLQNNQKNEETIDIAKIEDKSTDTVSKKYSTRDSTRDSTRKSENI